MPWLAMRLGAWFVVIPCLWFAAMAFAQVHAADGAWGYLFAVMLASTVAMAWIGWWTTLIVLAVVSRPEDDKPNCVAADRTA